jgi:hypothetical protein
MKLFYLARGLPTLMGVTLAVAEGTIEHGTFLFGP